MHFRRCSRVFSCQEDSQHFQFSCLGQICDLALPSPSKIYESWKWSSSVNIPGSDSVCNYVSQSLDFNWSRSEFFVLCHLCCNFFQAEVLLNSWTAWLFIYFIKLIITLRTLALHLRLVKGLSISYKSSVGRGKWGALTSCSTDFTVRLQILFGSWDGVSILDGKYCRKAILFLPMCLL